MDLPSPSWTYSFIANTASQRERSFLSHTILYTHFRKPFCLTDNVDDNNKSDDQLINKICV